tara:strand:- start:7 stop:1797 length:1791 start_codon:yes stop_codon:yes gene_type:complete
VIVGAREGDDGGDNAGEAYVIFGKSSGLTNIDLSSLTLSDGFVIQGDEAYDRAGYSVSYAGDVNGDGIDDLIVGAYVGDDGGTNAGEAYVTFGKSTGIANVDLSSLSLTDGFIIQGDASFDNLGSSVSSAGDVNGDGIDDVIEGAPYGEDGGPNAGEAYVIFGKSSGIANVDLSSLAASDGFIIQGDAASDQAGYSVSGAGDVNGDGIDDVIVGAIFADGTSSGEAYVIFGKSTGLGNIDLSSLAASDGFIIQGDTAEDRAGYSVSYAGDVNDDGIDDVIVGAILGDDGGPGAGEAYVIFGKSTGLANIDLSSLTPSDGFIIQGDVDSDYLGHSVAHAGDVNGDGIDDMIVGARFGASGAGEAYVLSGKSSGISSIDLSSFAASDGFIIQGDAVGVQAGYSVSGAGDVNGDGIDDVIVGAPFGDDGGTSAGEAYVVFGGSATGFGARVNLSALLPTYGFSILGKAAGDYSGAYLSDAGDVNGDGIDDVVIGAVGTSYPGVPNSGAAFVVFGKAGGPTTDIDLSSLTAADGWEITGAPLSQFSYNISGAGDVNGDGIDDLIVGARAYFGGQGAAYVIYGKSSGISIVRRQMIWNTSG